MNPPFLQLCHTVLPLFLQNFLFRPDTLQFSQNHPFFFFQRAEELEEAGTDSGMKDLQARIRSLEEQERTLLEKRNRLADVCWEVRNVLGILEDAAGYGRWDAGRGSLLSSFLKQKRVQKAKEAMIGLQEAVKRAKDVEDKQLSAAQDH